MKISLRLSHRSLDFFTDISALKSFVWHPWLATNAKRNFTLVYIDDISITTYTSTVGYFIVAQTLCTGETQCLCLCRQCKPDLKRRDTSEEIITSVAR